MERDQTCLRFERFSLDLKRGCLHVGDTRIELRPKSFQVLQCLAENAGTLISKEALFQTVWKQRVVGDDSLVQCIRELREKLGDDDHRLIKTVPRRGYLLDAERLSGDVPAPVRQTAPPDGAAVGLAAPAVEQARRRSFKDRYLRRSVAIWSALLLACGVAFAFTLGVARDWGGDALRSRARSSAAEGAIQALHGLPGDGRFASGRVLDGIRRGRARTAK